MTHINLSKLIRRDETGFVRAESVGAGLSEALETLPNTATVYADSLPMSSYSEGDTSGRGIGIPQRPLTQLPDRVIRRYSPSSAADNSGGVLPPRPTFMSVKKRQETIIPNAVYPAISARPTDISMLHQPSFIMSSEDLDSDDMGIYDDIVPAPPGAAGLLERLGMRITEDARLGAGRRRADHTGPSRAHETQSLRSTGVTNSARSRLAAPLLASIGTVTDTSSDDAPIVDDPPDREEQISSAIGSAPPGQRASSLHGERDRFEYRFAQSQEGRASALRQAEKRFTAFSAVETISAPPATSPVAPAPPVFDRRGQQDVLSSALERRKIDDILDRKEIARDLGASLEKRQEQKLAQQEQRVQQAVEARLIDFLNS